MECSRESNGEPQPCMDTNRAWAIGDDGVGCDPLGRVGSGKQEQRCGARTEFKEIKHSSTE